MKMSDLQYEAVQVTESIQELTEGTANEAKSMLGYVPKKEARPPEALLLASTLNRLGIEVLNKKQVRSYVIEKAIENSKAIIEEELSMENRFRLDCFVGYAVQKAKISDYTRQIPEHILSRAIEIKRELPDAEFHVLSIERDPDPFLIVELGDFREWFFVGVWAEPRFERQ